MSNFYSSSVPLFYWSIGGLITSLSEAIGLSVDVSQSLWCIASVTLDVGGSLAPCLVLVWEINRVTLHLAQLILAWVMGDHLRVAKALWYVISHPGQLDLLPVWDGT